MIINDEINVKLFAPCNHRIEERNIQGVKCIKRTAGGHAIHIYRQADYIAPKAFDIDNILFRKSGKLNLPRAICLKPPGQIYTPAKGSL